MNGKIFIPHSDEWMLEALRTHAEIDSKYGEADNSEIQFICLEAKDLQKELRSGSYGVGLISHEYISLQHHGFKMGNVLLSNGRLVLRSIPASFLELSTVWVLRDEAYSVVASQVESRLRQMTYARRSKRRSVIAFFKSEIF